MIIIDNKSKCSGCTACFSICPQKCIEMLPDSEGFLYPAVDADNCIDCHLCEKVCPILNKITISNQERKTYAINSKDDTNRINSSSGGMFLPLFDYVLSQKGIMYTAIFDKDFNVVHERLDAKPDGETLNRIRGSKYVQSNMIGIYPQVKTDVQKGKIVCFIGTPCQVYGLKKYLGKEYENLLTVDLVCHGVPSPALWEKYLRYQKNKYKSQIKSIQFRGKKYGYHSGGFFTIFFENGKEYCASARVDFMLKAFFKEISSRKSCYHCSFKQLKRCSDLTLYDCWHFSELIDNAVPDDNKGYTNVIVQSEKGMQILRAIADSVEMHSILTDKAERLDGKMISRNAVPNASRDQFYITLNENGISEAINRYIPVSKIDHLIEHAKKIAYKTKIIKSRRKK